MKTSKIFIFILGITLLSAPFAWAEFEITDTQGRKVYFDQVPGRAVSVVPSTTEIICRLGAADHLKGVTWHSTLPKEKNSKEIMGGFFSPSVEKIIKAVPDMVFISDYQKDTARILEKNGITTVYTNTKSFEQSLANISMIAEIFQKKDQAEKIIAKIRTEIDLVRKKIDKIPMSERKHVFRLMGRDKIMTPAKGAFLNDLVKLAGGIPMEPQGPGMAAEVSVEQWQEFNPEIIFGCGDDKKAAEKFFHLPGWKNVDGVKNHRTYYFPCELTCRAASNTGYFVQWLSSVIYKDYFFKESNYILKDQIVKIAPIHFDPDFDIIKNSEIITSTIADFQHKTLVIDFKEPQKILSTLQGIKTGISSVANHYLPPPSWSMPHDDSLDKTEARIVETIKREKNSTALLMTGADMDNLALASKSFKAMRVCAAVTAGISSNAQRMSRSTGRYYEPGTINIIIITNMKLSERAMTRTVITATEAKTAALSDMDIRSSYQPLKYQATGTGTDNIIIVQGKGEEIDKTGGHSKMGELIAKAVYAGVQKAIFLQNGYTTQRNIFQRLHERGISVFSLVKSSTCLCTKQKKNSMAAELERILMEPEYISLVDTAFALSDDYEKGVIRDLSFFKGMCRSAAEKEAGTKIDNYEIFLTPGLFPEVLEITFNNLLTGISQRVNEDL
ncbi:MAG: adenosylcobinamide amidohydrolase [Thermodesulfobacteriota bacterium]|nr:adenosylcobinamide amidohydrolase [Thermodesulfobacteriota bacterium]